MIDVLFLSSNENLYAGTEDGGGKFSGYAVANGKLKGAYRTGITGKPLGRIVGEPLDLKAGDQLPGNTDLHLEGATTVTIAKYLDSAARREEALKESAKEGTPKPPPHAKKAKPASKARGPKKKAQADDAAAEEKADEAGE